MRVAMIGTGYVGLVSGACFSDFGHDVVCIDKDHAKIDALKNGIIPIYEPGLDALVAENVKKGRLSFTTSLAEGVKGAEAIFIAVGTPSRRGDGHADLSFVFKASEEIADALTGYAAIVTKSTVPVGTGQKVEDVIRGRRKDVDVDVISNPEFLREGSAIEDFKRPDRVVVGADTDRGRDVMRRLYRPLHLNEKTPFLFTTRESSELIKYAANAFLAMKITFINEIADICEKVGADVQDVSRGIGLDGRIGSKFLNAGPGYGGSCFPKDTLALDQTAQAVEAPSELVQAVIRVNASRKKRMAERVIKTMGGSVAGKTIAVLGLAFKPNTDDMRDSPSLDIVPALIAAGAKVRAFDPASMKEARKHAELAGLDYATDAYDALKGADACVIVTEWNEFRALDFKRMAGIMRGRAIIDLRNIYAPGEPASEGFDYVSIGRPSVRSKR